MTLTSGTRYLVDSNILVYGVDKDSPFHSRARDLLEELLAGNVWPVVAHQNLVEYTAVLTRAYGVSSRQTSADVRAFASRFEVITPLPTTIDVFLRLVAGHQKIYPFDLYLAATMLDNGVERIITANRKDFAGLDLQEVISLK